MQQQDEQGAGEWVSISGAAKRLGVSRQAVQDRIRRRRIPTREDNRGNTQVLVPLAAATSCKPALSTETPASVEPVADVLAIRALERAFAELSATCHRQIAAERRRADMAEARLAAEQSRKLTVLERLIGRRITNPQADSDLVRA